MQKLSLISVEPEPLPSFGEVMTVLDSFVRLLYESLDAGATVCRRYYEELSAREVPEPYLREMMVRAQAKRYLGQNGLQVKKIKERGFSLVSEPLLSLLIHYKGFAIRVLKAKKGIPPGCGKSKRRKDFYSQVPVAYLGDDGKPAHSKTNLLVFWDFSSTFGIANVWIACPEVAGARPQDVVLAWQELVPNPVVQTAPLPPAQEEAVQRDKEADQEIEALLVGRASTALSASRESTPLDRDQSAVVASTVSEMDSEEEADDRRSHKVSA
jgi:hypothetical protein